MMSLEFLAFLLIWFAGDSAADTKLGCQPRCGNISIPYPFGIGRNCSIAGWANINCNATFNPPRPFILGDLEVMQFSASEVRIKNVVATTCYNSTGAEIKKSSSLINLDGTPYTFSSKKNKLMAVGCDTLARSNLDGGRYSLLCLCTRVEDVIQGFCSGLGCCQTSIPKGRKKFSSLTSSLDNHTGIWSFDSCGSSFLGEQNEYNFKVSDFSDTDSLRDVPIVLNFGVGNRTCESAKQDDTTYACKDNSYCYNSVDGAGYLCNCSKGYERNPYLDQGCQDVNECADTNNGGCEGICTNTAGSYNCSCPDDSYGDGTKQGSGCTIRIKKVPILQLTLELSTRSFVREFSEDEESLVARMFKLLGSRWSLIAGRMPGRNAEEIEHYCTSTYSPPTQTNQLSEDEEALVHMMFKLVGGRWHLIAGRIPGRTPEQIRIYWTTKYSAE